MTLQEFAYGLESAGLISLVSEEGSAAQRFYSNSLYQYFSNGSTSYRLGLGEDQAAANQGGDDASSKNSRDRNDRGDPRLPPLAAREFLSISVGLLSGFKYLLHLHMLHWRKAGNSAHVERTFNCLTYLVPSEALKLNEAGHRLIEIAVRELTPVELR